MKIVWDRRAVRDLTDIWSYIAQDNISAAEETVQRIRGRVFDLAIFPETGRSGRIARTRELVVSPYIVIYKVFGDRVGVKAVLHGRQRWPKRL